jgi:pilus assembly protein CpaC
MKKKLMALVLTASALATLSFSPLASAAGNGIELTVGGQRQLATGSDLQRIAVGDPAVADIVVTKGQHGSVLLIGKSTGTTDVLLWPRGSSEPIVYTVTVASAASRALLGPGAPQLRNYNGVQVISGSATGLEAHQRAVDAASVGCDTASGSLIDSLSHTDKKGEAASAGSNAGSAKCGNVIDTSNVTGKDTVQVDVRVVEFSRTVLKEAGLNIYKLTSGFTLGAYSPGSASPSTSLTSIPSAISSAFNLVVGSVGKGIFGDISLLEQNNLARVLAQPTLTALSGQTATFLAGGEIPIPTSAGLGSTSIEWKPYGVALSLTPTVLGPRRIALKVAPEASELDYVHSITSSGTTIPGITTRRADTMVELGDGESFVIGGLIDRETTSNVQKVPLLGDLPIIGTFFKDLNYEQDDKELVIIVTPHLVSPIAAGATLPTTPGELSEQRNGPVWGSYLGGALSKDAGPGFSK